MHTPQHSSQAGALEKSLFVRALKAVNVCFARIFHNVEVLSPCPLPRTGRAILACNHISGLDPALIQSCTSRVIVWMTAHEYVEQPGMRWLFRTVRAIPVKRGERDMSATRQALRALADGYVLGVFPEGQIETKRELLPFQTGVAVLAARTGTPIYPVALEGTQRGREMLEAILRPQKSRLVFGQRLDLSELEPDQRQPEPATILLQQRIEALRQRLI